MLPLVLLAQIVLNPAKDPSVIQVDVDLVNVLCTVRDQNGEFVGNLSKGDFQVKEDGKRQPISMFARQADTPLTVALLLDVSGSVQLILGSEKAAARRFFAEALRPGDRALLVGFAQLIAVWQDLTPSVDALQAALEKAGPFQRSDASTMGGTPRGGTLLYDAVKLVAEQKLLHLSGRKVMVVISDGIDQGSIASLSKAVQAAQEADTVVYGIHYEDALLESQEWLSPGMPALERLAGQTGGRTFRVTANEANKKDTLESVFQAINEEMRNQYALGYRPPGKVKDGAYHKLEVKVDKPGVKVQARAGYFAVPR